MFKISTDRSMELFFILLQKLFPLYILIALGYVAGVFFRVKRDPVAFLLLYILSPLVVMDGAMTVTLNRGTLSLPLLFLIICSTLCWIFFSIGSCVWKRGDSMRNLAAFASANGNTGYFGIPVALALFPKDILGIVVLSSFGFVLYECTTGFFLLARGNYSYRESVVKLIKLPLLYAFVLGLAVNAVGFTPPALLVTALDGVRSAYSIFGMMLIGIALARQSRSAFDGRLLVFTTIAKCVIWPALMLMLIGIDRHFLHVFGEDVHGVLMGMVPLAVNTVVYSSALKVHPEKASVAVMVSTLIALPFIPLLSVLFL